jgi:hypothetical protein
MTNNTQKKMETKSADTSTDDHTWFVYRGAKHKGSICEDIKVPSLKSRSVYGNPEEVWFSVNRFDDWEDEVHLKVNLGGLLFEIVMAKKDAINLGVTLTDVASATHLGQEDNQDD